MPDAGDWADTERLLAIELDDHLARSPTPEVAHERQVAIYDLLHENRFSAIGHEPGPYRLYLSLDPKGLVFDIRKENDEPAVIVGLSLTPLRRIVRDYLLICDRYFEAVRTAPPSRIETIDMARRGLHEEGAEILSQRLAGKVRLDRATARRLFTLITALHWRG